VKTHVFLNFYLESQGKNYKAISRTRVCDFQDLLFFGGRGIRKSQKIPGISVQFFFIGKFPENKEIPIPRNPRSKPWDIWDIFSNF